MAKISAKKRQHILDVLATGTSITGACRAAGVATATVRNWRNEKHDLYDPDFAQAAETAIEEGTDLLEDYAETRARNGSDVLTIFLLKGRRPTKYRDNAKVTVAGDETAPLRVEHSVKGVRLTDVLDLANRIGPAPSSNDG